MTHIDLPSDQQSKEVLTGQKCPYCNEWTECTNSGEIYGKEYGPIYICRPCKAWVGCHKDPKRSRQALGRLANAELREWKKAAHAHFDPLWKLSTKKHKRARAYAWLAKEMNLTSDHCHIGMFNVEQCQRVIQICQQLVNSLMVK